MPESPLPAKATISPENYATDTNATVTSVTSEATFYRKERIITPRRTDRWRSTSTAIQLIDLDLGTERSPTLFALIDSNLGNPRTDRATLEARYDLWLRSSDISNTVSGSTLFESVIDQSTGDHDIYTGALFPSLYPAMKRYYKLDNTTLGSLTSWPDATNTVESGGTSLTQPTPTKAPAVLPGIANGNPAALFLGVNILGTSSGSNVSLGANHMISITFMFLNVSGTQYFMSDGSNGFLRWSGTQFVYQNASGSSQSFTPGITIATNTWYILTVRRIATVLIVQLNGTTIGTLFLSDGTTVFNLRYIGATGSISSPSSGLIGYISDIIIDTALTSPDTCWQYQGTRNSITTTDHPTYTSSSTNLDLPAIVFDGGDVIQTASSINFGSTQTITAVFVRTSQTGVSYIIGDDSTNSYFGWDTTGTDTLVFRSNGTAQSVTSTLTDNTAYIYTVRRAGTNVDFFLNGIQIGATQTTAGTNNFTMAAVGSNSAIANGGELTGELYEVIIDQSSMTDQDITSLHGYLAQDYGIDISTDQFVKLQTLTGVGGSVSQTWVLPLYDVSVANRVHRWYIGDDTEGNAVVASRYWRVRIPASMASTDPLTGVDFTYYECGAIWIGEYTEVLINEGAKIDTVDPSDIDKSYNGSRYPDRIKTYHSMALEFPHLTISELFDLKEKLELAGSNSFILIDIYAPIDSDIHRQHGCYYGLISKKGIKSNHKQQTSGTIQIQFEEAAK